MATVNKDFKVKYGLIVEGSTATVNGHDVLTRSTSDINYIISQVGGSAVSTNTPNTIVLRDANGNFAAGTITADLVGNVTGNASTATTLETARTISLGGDVTGSVSFDGSQNVTITATVDSSFATDAEVATAKAQAITAAGEYTNSEIGDLDTALKAYTDQAEADAISTAAADATSKANAAEVAAIAAAALDATTKANAAQAAAEATAAADATSKANAAETAAIAAAAADATSKANAAETAAKAYTDARETAITSAYEAYADQAEEDAKSYTDTAVANLVDGAPALLDTLNELAAALADDENFATTIASDIATGMQTAKDYSDSQDALQTTALKAYADQAEADAIATAAADATSKANAAQAAAEATAAADATTKANAAQAAAISTAAADATSKANAAETAAKAYTDTREVAITTAYQSYADAAKADAISTAAADATSKANAAQAAAEVFTTSAINALNTDDIEEGTTNKYFTDARAQAAVAGDITSAINALDTNDIEEGSSNLYFTDQRARDAVAADIESAVAAGDVTATPVYAAVNVNYVAKQVASTVSVATASTATAFEFSYADYTSAKFFVKFSTATHTEVSEVVLTLDSSLNVAITEYGSVGTNGSMGTVSADVDSTAQTVRLRVTTVNNNTDVTTFGTLIV